MTEKENKQAKTLKNNQTERTKKKFLERRSFWYLMTFLAFLLIVVLGAAFGVFQGIRDRVQLAEAQAAPRIQSQLDRARQDIEEGRYEVALGRLDWILDEMSEYLNDEELAEIGEVYSQTLLLLSQVGAPTPASSPTPIEPEFTPTPDLRGVEDLYNTARQQFMDQLWDDAINTIIALREKDLYFRSIQVDGMLYVALRNRGLDKILIEGSLEPGIYDLTLAERFAPLDSRAEGLRTWTRFYLTGASYWGVDWEQVVFYFEQVYPHLPNLRDGTNMTATERFRIGAIEYGSQLAAIEEFCLAQEYFDRAFALAPDPEVQPTAQWVAEECWNIQNPPAPPQTQPATPTPTPDGGVGVPTETPTPESTAENGGE